MDLNQVTVPCSDLTTSVAFYRALGLRQIVSHPPDYARFECPVGGSTFSLHRASAGSGDGGIVIHFEVDDLDAGPRDQTWLWREAYLRDRLVRTQPADSRADGSGHPRV